MHRWLRFLFLPFGSRWDALFCVRVSMRWEQFLWLLVCVPMKYTLLAHIFIKRVANTIFSFLFSYFACFLFLVCLCYGRNIIFIIYVYYVGLLSQITFKSYITQYAECGLHSGTKIMENTPSISFRNLSDGLYPYYYICNFCVSRRPSGKLSKIILEMGRKPITQNKCIVGINCVCIHWLPGMKIGII